jgi:8-oxo-dGTP pyrophosphatase MutT (NUDIX family)
MDAPRLAALLELLRGHQPLDAVEAQHQHRMIELATAGLTGTLDPFSRACFDPGHFTASSFVIAPERDALLLILHAKLGFWMQPGGHVDPEDPDVLSAARREVREETGLQGLERWPPGAPLGLLDLDIHPIPARREEPEHEHFDLRFLFLSPTLELGDSDEIRGIRWVPFDRVESVRSDASVMRAVTRLRRRLRELDRCP